jgi:hypothetical protein
MRSRHFRRCERAQHEHLIHSMGSDLPFAAVCIDGSDGPFAAHAVQRSAALNLGFQRGEAALDWGFKRGQRAPLP